MITNVRRNRNAIAPFVPKLALVAIASVQSPAHVLQTSRQLAAGMDPPSGCAGMLNHGVVVHRK